MMMPGFVWKPPLFILHCSMPSLEIFNSIDNVFNLCFKNNNALFSMWHIMEYLRYVPVESNFLDINEYDLNSELQLPPELKYYHKVINMNI